MEQAKKYWSAQLPEAVESGRVTFHAMDFFVETPVQGCDIYYVR